jgi:hypothetical protein
LNRRAEVVLPVRRSVGPTLDGGLRRP